MGHPRLGLRGLVQLGRLGLGLPLLPRLQLLPPLCPVPSLPPLLPLLPLLWLPLPPLLLLLTLLLCLQLRLRLGAGLQAGQLLGWLQLQLGPPRLGLGLGRTGLPQLGRLGEVGLGLPRLSLSQLLPLLLPRPLRLLV